MVDLETQVQELDREVRTLNRALTGQRNWLKVASEYKNDDPIKLVEGIQAALKKAAEYEPRQQNGKRHRR